MAGGRRDGGDERRTTDKKQTYCRSSLIALISNFVEMCVSSIEDRIKTVDYDGLYQTA